MPIQNGKVWLVKKGSLIGELLRGVGSSVGPTYEGLVEGWNALSADRQEEFRSL